MAENDTARSRLVIAVTELTPLRLIWQGALEHLEDPQAEILALFFAEDHWHRAARLPFTREISRISGTAADFTLKRANQVYEEAIAAARRRMHELAAEAKLSLSFQVLTESDQQRIREFVAGPQNIVIAPAFLTTRPLLAALRDFGCRIVLIDSGENADWNS